MNVGNAKRNGVTLIEVVVALLLSGIMTGIAAVLILFITQGYFTVQQQVGLSQSMELAMSRLSREMRSAETISGGGSTVTFLRGGVVRQFSLSGNTLSMRVNGADFPLMRNVAEFNVQPNLLGQPGLVTFSIAPVGNIPPYSIQVLFQPEED